MQQVQQAKPQFQKVAEHLKEVLATLRTGRAHPALVEHLQVEAYGMLQPLKSLASISVPDSKTLQIEPWDATVVGAIESAINKSEIGINPNVDGKTIRLIMPMMTDENRQRLVKQVREKVEEAKIAVRRVREEVKKEVEKTEGVSEDLKRSELEALDAQVKDFNGQIDTIGKDKEQQILTI
jgi:ribosome recycling factor